ncbi:MAG: biotin/lipoate A/B protein ligase family protein [Syntrophothermus sp.]
MNWYLLNTGSNPGRFNMDLDVELARKCREGEAFLRFYRWEPYCISLGANQKFEDINAESTRAAGIDFVKRPTGGRAILHAEEITYSVIMPASVGVSSTEIYRRISLALVSGLSLYDDKLKDVELETIQPDFASLLKDPSGVVCFGSTAKSEVKFHGRKLIGSAQRKMGKSLLQHGSLLCGSYHLRLADFLNMSGTDLARIREEMTQKTVDLHEILGEEADYEKLTELLTAGFEKEFDIKLTRAPETLVQDLLQNV